MPDVPGVIVLKLTSPSPSALPKWQEEIIPKVPPKLILRLHVVLSLQSSSSQVGKIQQCLLFSNCNCNKSS